MDSVRPKQNLKRLVSVVFLFATISHGGKAHPAIELDISKRDATYNSALTLISFEREPTSVGNNFTLRYTKNADHLIFRVQDNLGAPRAPTVVEEVKGVWAASFVLPRTAHVSQWFIIGDSDFQHMVAINVDNSESTPAQQNIAELPVLHVSPPSEAVYEPHEDVHITAFVPRNSQTGEVVSNFRKMFSGVDLNTLTMHQDLDDDDLFTLGHPVVTEEKVQANITIHTSTRPVSGHLQLSTNVYNTGGTLAQIIQVSRSIVVRPFSQAGPYPAGYLTIIEGFSSQTSKNGHELYRCRVGMECLYFCVSVGDSISSLEVKEVQADGGFANVPSAGTGPEILETSRDIYWKFQAEEDSGDSDGITTFQCKATDITHGHQVTKFVDVLAEIPSSINQTRSQVTVQDHPNDPIAKVLTFQCAIRGRPLPDVIFYGGSTRQFPIFAANPTNVTTTGLNEAIAFLVVSVDAVDLTHAVERISQGWDTSPACYIYSDTRGDSISYDFYPTLC
ncbi:hypothetical protein RRG08_021768 [Elysia crispata]|uniref:Uncharacterized protein n=1 Tax=Elysia crispata TaxID=231223 RepID=A0AAE0ZZW9_9GAST|nr:hypothetical protein RRG08_021768 [Elysia crispata]